MASYWNLPYYPEWCRDQSMDYFKTLIRVTGSYTSLGMSVLALVRYYGWRRAIVLSDPDTTPCFYGAQAIDHFLGSSSANMSFFTWVLMSEHPSDDDIDNYLSRIRDSSRGKAFRSTRIHMDLWHYINYIILNYISLK